MDPAVCVKYVMAPLPFLIFHVVNNYVHLYKCQEEVDTHFVCLFCQIGMPMSYVRTNVLSHTCL